MIERSRRVVLLIDYDNLQICASRDTPGRELQLPPVVQLAQRYGTVILARAYAEWNLSTERLAVYKAGIEPAFAPVLRTESDRSGKSLADTVMVAEGMDMLWTLSPDVVVLATSDKDLIPLVRVAKQRGAFVVVLGSDFTAIPLREMADEHVTYRQLITDGSGRLIDGPGISRQPSTLPEPARRRPAAGRTGRERVAGTPVAAPAVAAAPSPAPVRQEREASVPQAVPSSVAPASSVAGPAEPVAPVSGALGAEGDAQTGLRRRRRRGSRRRSERLGLPGESISGGEPGASTDAVGTGGMLFHDSGAESPDAGGDLAADLAEEEITPTSSTLDVAEASGGTIEEPFQAPASEPPVTEPSAAPVLRDRRRRTRRPAVEVEATVDVAPSPDAIAALEAEGVAGEAALSSEGLADMLVGGDPAALENGTHAPDEATPAAPVAAPRPRRVASASRGRRLR